MPLKIEKYQNRSQQKKIVCFDYFRWSINENVKKYEREVIRRSRRATRRRSSDIFSSQRRQVVQQRAQLIIKKVK